jgi:hypothetical protein
MCLFFFEIGCFEIFIYIKKGLFDYLLEFIPIKIEYSLKYDLVLNANALIETILEKLSFINLNLKSKR